MPKGVSRVLDYTAVIETFEKKLKIKYIYNEKNMGNAYSRNVAMKQSKSKYIAFMDDDDVALPNKFVTISEALKDNYDLIFTAVILQKNDESKMTTYNFVNKKELFSDFMPGNSIIYSASVVVKKSLMEKVGGFNGNIKKGVDSFFYRKALAEKSTTVMYYETPTLLVDETSEQSMTRSRSFENSYNGLMGEIVNIRYFGKYYKLPDFFKRFRKIAILFMRMFLSKVKL